MRAATAILSAIVLSSCAAVTTPRMETAREAIDRGNASVVRAYAAGDADSVASLFAVDAWQMPPNSPALVGREAIRGFWREALKWGQWDFALTALDVSESGPMAVERGKYSLTFKPGPGAPPGMPGFTDRGHYLVHWRLESDGQWRAVSDAPVSELPR